LRMKNKEFRIQNIEQKIQRASTKGFVNEKWNHPQDRQKAQAHRAGKGITI